MWEVGSDGDGRVSVLGVEGTFDGTNIENARKRKYVGEVNVRCVECSSLVSRQGESDGQMSAGWLFTPSAYDACLSCHLPFTLPMSRAALPRVLSRLAELLKMHQEV